MPMGLWRASGGTWLALVHSPAGVWLWASGGASPSDRLSRRIPLVGAEGAAPLATPGPVVAAACSLDASDRVHLAWQAGETLYYARCALEDLPKGTGWRGPMGEPAPAIVARGVTPRACALAAGARPAIAGERGLLVLGTDHAAEAVTGFYTKHGDGGVDARARRHRRAGARHPQDDARPARPGEVRRPRRRRHARPGSLRPAWPRPRSAWWCRSRTRTAAPCRR